MPGISRRVMLLASCWMLLAAPAASQLAPLAEGGARAIALGRATTASTADLWGVANPASWAAIEQASAAAFVSQAFGMTELRLAAAGLAHPTPYGVAVGGARTYGFEEFRENVFTLGFGRAFALSPTRHLDAGVALRYTSVSIPGFGSAGAIGLSAGLLVELLPGLHLGTLAHNLNRPALSDLDPLETRLDAGLSFQPHEAALVLIAASKDLDYPLSVRGGVELQPVDVLFVRAGFSTEPTRFSGGFGLAMGRLRVDLAGEHHHFLGWTPAIEVGIQW